VNVAQRMPLRLNTPPVITVNAGQNILNVGENSVLMGDVKDIMYCTLEATM